MPGSVLSIFLLYSSEQYYEKRNVSFTSYIIKQAEEVFTLSYHIVITSRRRLNKMACGLCLPHQIEQSRNSAFLKLHKSQWQCQISHLLAIGYLYLDCLYQRGTRGVSEGVKLLSRVRLFATPWTVAYKAPPSMGFSRQGYWSGLPFHSPGTRGGTLQMFLQKPESWCH